MTPVRFARHTPVAAFDIKGGELYVNGVGVIRLARRSGSTPFYAYSRDALTRQVASLRAAMPNSVKLHYAMKANPMPALVQHLVPLLDGIDVASTAEMKVALDSGAPPSSISYAGPSKTMPDIERAVAAGIVLNIESELQLSTTIEVAERLGYTPNIAIRVNPMFELKSSGMKMGGGAKQFGVDEGYVSGLLATIKAAGLMLHGLHIYCGSQNLSASAICDAQNRTLELALRICNESDTSISWINMGGGFGVPYFAGDQPLDVAEVGHNMAPLAERALRELNAELHLELGRYLVAEAGVYVCRVVDVKQSRGETFVVLDGGMNHNLAASGNLGQVIRKNYPVAILNRLDETQLVEQTVTGPLCTPLDMLAHKVFLPLARPGDLFGVFLAGAYGPTASPLGFLSHPQPVEMLV